MSNTQQQISLFIDSLARHRARAGYYNPYREAPARHNLYQYLLLMAKLTRHPMLIVGEAPGYKGCRLTGIPFSSSDFVTNPPHQFWRQLAPKLHVNTAVRENTASIVWNFLNTQEQLPLFWNAFPFHPYQAYKPKSNRCPNIKELRLGKQYLEQLAEIFSVSEVVGLGRRGHYQAQQCFPELQINYVRHPSFGGKTAFITQMMEIFSAGRTKQSLK